jgi:PTH1 family peptidyl-tRNA hydrolase
MHLVVGLGNPGPKYAGNRHNVGFMVVDRLASRLGAPPFKEKFKGVFTKAPLGADDVVLLKPMTYMNVSGESAQPAAAFFRVALEQLVVVHDELDLPFGTLRLKVGGGTAGHNGLKSLQQQLGDPGFVRLRFGIGRPRSGSPVSYVLGDFDGSERAELPDLLDRAADALETVVREGAAAAMNSVNQRA